MSVLLGLLDVSDRGEDTWRGPASGPEGKRAYGGQLVAQSLAAAARTVDCMRGLLATTISTAAVLGVAATAAPAGAGVPIAPAGMDARASRYARITFAPSAPPPVVTRTRRMPVPGRRATWRRRR